MMAPAKSVANPLAADLDGGGHNITGVANFQSSGGAQIGGAGTTCAENVLVDNLANPAIFASDLTGTIDPSAAGLDRNPGSLYRQVTGGQFGTAAIWFKHGSGAHDWRAL